MCLCPLQTLAAAVVVEGWNSFTPYNRVGMLKWDCVFYALAVAFVYPDRVLEWISGHTGWTLGLVHGILLELATAGLSYLVWRHVKEAGYTVVWWEPLAFLLVPVVTRVVTRFFVKLFDFEDD